MNNFHWVVTMTFRSKAIAYFYPKISDVGKGVYGFFVHAEDQILFKHEMARLLKDKKVYPQNVPLILTLSRYHPPKTRSQENMYRKIVREICTQEQSEAYGSDPDNVHLGIVARAALSYGYPTITAAGVRIPLSTTKASTTEINLLMEVARVVAGECNADVSNIGLGD